MVAVNSGRATRRAVIRLWLLLLFYLLGDTASEYLCASLEGQSLEHHAPAAARGRDHAALARLSLPPHWRLAHS
jgi:hypothetical protein